MNNKLKPTQADEYRELSSGLRVKQRVLTAVFTAWWAVNGIMIAWLLTTERLSAILLIFVGLFGFVINSALHIQVWEIRYLYHKQSKRLRDIQDNDNIIPPKPYCRWRSLKSENIYNVIGISMIIIWFGVFIFGLVLAGRYGLLTSLMPG